MLIKCLLSDLLSLVNANSLCNGDCRLSGICGNEGDAVPPLERSGVEDKEKTLKPHLCSHGERVAEGSPALRKACAVEEELLTGSSPGAFP